MACFDSVSANCIEVNPDVPYQAISGENLDDVLSSIDGKLQQLAGILTTTGLVPRTLPPGSLASLPALLQALINGFDAHSTSLTSLTGKLTPGFLLDQPTTLSNGASVKQILTDLLGKVSSLQADVAAIKAGQPASTSLYVPHY